MNSNGILTDLGHDTFLAWPSSGTLKIKRLESQVNYESSFEIPLSSSFYLTTIPNISKGGLDSKEEI
jgi:hypothetical protein